MCGLVGSYKSCQDEASLKKTIKSMIASLHHRGPDDNGYWLESNLGLGLGHTRLAIQDLSAAGRQPMTSHSGRFKMVFNGEIYNHFDLRDLLRDENFNSWIGYSDTETLLAGFEHWGIKETIIKSKGMFAFAIYDSKLNTLTLGRDRMGEKPLYYGWQGDSFVFASELKALKVHPDFLNIVNRKALTDYLKYSYVPGIQCIFDGIKKLEPGSLLNLSLEDQNLKIENYWDLTAVISESKNLEYDGNIEDALNTLEMHLSKSIKKQMLSDVPLGAFLSGGVDSSTVVSLMQSQSDKPINTFSIGFDIKGFNEAEHAKSVASHLGTNHKELYVTSEMALDVVQKLPSLYDEPFADSSQIPTYLVSKMASKYVTVALSGDAGDELFCGYNRYLATRKLWPVIKFFPLKIRKVLAYFLILIPESAWNKIFYVLPFGKNWAHIGQKIHKGASVLKAKNLNDLYTLLISQWDKPEQIVLGGINQDTEKIDQNKLQLCDVEYMMAKDISGYLCDDILVKVDRAAMGNSLETRVPMLDHDLVSYAWSLPLSLKLKDGVSKWPLRQILYRYVPKSLIDRPKVGFAVPLDEWLRGPLLNWANELLNPELINSQGFFNNRLIQEKWEQHKNGKYNFSNQLWSILIFQAWLLEQGNIK